MVLHATHESDPSKAFTHEYGRLSSRRSMSYIPRQGNPVRVRIRSTPSRSPRPKVNPYATRISVSAIDHVVLKCSVFSIVYRYYVF